jgi:hypothetical protein
MIFFVPKRKNRITFFINGISSKFDDKCDFIGLGMSFWHSERIITANGLDRVSNKIDYLYCNKTHKINRKIYREVK